VSAPESGQEPHLYKSGFKRMKSEGVMGSMIPTMSGNLSLNDRKRTRVIILAGLVMV